MTGADVEKSSYGAFERFLFIVTPIIFTIVLLGVLFALFDASVMNGVLRAANKVPVLEKFVPDPNTQEKVTLPRSGDTAAATSADAKAALEEVKAKLAQKEAELQEAAAANQQKDQTIKDLKAQIATLEEQMKTKTQTDEEYRAQIQQLASVYAKMSPSKSAPILENMTLKERVLVLSEMKPDDRGKILEKMDPKKAAEASIQLKDVVPAKDRQIAALQERLLVNQETEAKAPQAISQEELGRTFSEMNPKSAATILVEMSAANQPRVLAILRAMDSLGRAKVLDAISGISKQTAAAISAKLAE